MQGLVSHVQGFIFYSWWTGSHRWAQSKNAVIILEFLCRRSERVEYEAGTGWEFVGS